MQNKPLWKFLALSIVSLMLVTCATSSIAFDSANNVSNQLDDTSENITADNTPFPYLHIPIDDDMRFDLHFVLKRDYVTHDSEFIRFEENLHDVKGYSSVNASQQTLEKFDQNASQQTIKKSLKSYVSLSSNTFYVPDHYAKIQLAEDNASAGDTIIVRGGTYVENINVNKRLTIQSEKGSNSTIVQAATSSDHVFEVEEVIA